jgi:ribose transport system permease protein
MTTQAEIPTTTPTTTRTTTPFAHVLRAGSARYGLLILTIGLIVVFSILEPATFPTVTNAQIIAGNNSVSLILALGVLIPLVVGEFDLSVGANLGFSTVLFAVLTGGEGGGFVAHLPVWLAFGVVVLAGGVIGLVNGILLVKFRVTSFIATLGTGTLLAGFTLFFTDGSSIFAGVPPQVFQIGSGQIGGFPLVAIYAIVIAVFFWYLLLHTPLGRRLYAVGGSQEAARLAGVPVARIRIGAFVASGVLAALAGTFELGRIGAAHPGLGAEFLLPALAAGFLGAMVIRPGTFNPVGVAIAVIFLAVGTVGLQQVGAPFWAADVFDGLALLIAVTLFRPFSRART